MSSTHKLRNFSEDTKLQKYFFDFFRFIKETTTTWLYVIWPFGGLPGA